MNPHWHIAQINVGTALYPTDDQRMSGFTNRLDEINALAEQSTGFVWRLQDESGNATDIDTGGPPLFIVNMSVWDRVETLFEFVYKTAHRPVMTDRRQWFARPDGAYQVLWWIPAGHIPTVEEGLQRLELLKSAGPSPRAFSFKAKYPCPDLEGGPNDMQPAPYCSGWE